MFNFTKKKTIGGLIGVVVSIVLAAVCGGFDKGGPIENLTGGGIALRLLCVTGIALALGFVMLVLFDWKMFAVFFVGMEVLAVLRIVSAVQVGAGIAFFAVLVVGGSIFGCVFQYRKCKYDINGATTPRQIHNEEKHIEQAQKMLAEDEELKRSIRYLEKSIVLCSPMGALFQVIKTEREYYFHYVGSMMTRIDWSRCITDFDNIEQYRHKKDYTIGITEIERISTVLRVTVPFYDTLKIKRYNKRAKVYSYINLMEQDELITFFGSQIEVIDKRKDIAPQEEITDGRKAVLNKINLARFIFSVLSVVIFTAYIFFNTEKTDVFLTVLAIAICLAPLVTYLCLQEYISIRDIGKFTQPDSDKINFLFTVIIFPMVFAIKCLLTGYFTIDYELLELFLYSLIPLAVLSVVLFVICKEYKKYKSCIFGFLIAAVAFCPSFIYKVNSAFDFRQPQEITCQVTEMPTHTDNKGDVTYYLVVKYDGKTVKAEVDEEEYNQTTVGGEVTVLRYHGALGIRSEYLE